MTTEDAGHNPIDSQQVFAEQVGLVYQLGVVGALAVMVVAWLYTLVVWTVVPQRELIGWAVAVTLVSALRIALAQIKKRQTLQSHTREWAWGLIVLATLTGLLWAYAGTALYPHRDSQMHLIAAFILVGIPAGAVASFGPYAKSYACYLVSTIMPFAASLYLRGGEAAGWLLLTSLVFMLYLIRVALWSEKTLRDNITQRLALQRMARGFGEARDAAESADRAKSNFLANLSEDVRTPLNAIRDINEQLLGTPLNAAQRDKVQAAHQASLSLLDTLDSARDMSRIHAGQLDIHEERFDPQAILARIERMYRPAALRKQLDLNVAIAAGVPHAVMGDPVRWLQVLGILVDNAIKFTDRGLVSVDIEASVNGGVCALRAEVADTGIGLAPEEQYRFFKRLAQTEVSTSPRHGGAGLGIASDLAKLMGGDIGVTSEKGKGSRFWFNARLRIAPEQHRLSCCFE
jgi:signal transduction histidine kinase